MDFIKLLNKSAVFSRITEALRTQQASSIGGLWGSSAAYFLAGLVSESKSRNWLVITSQIEEAENILEDLHTFLPVQKQNKLCLFPAWERLVSADINVAPDPLILRERIQTILKLNRSEKDTIIIAPIQALLQPVPIPKKIAEHTVTFVPGNKLNLEEFTQKLVTNKWSRLETIEGPGEFSIRGGILDLYPFEFEHPLRIELMDNRIESIRFFNPETQLSETPIKEISFCLISSAALYKFSLSEQTTLLLDYLDIAETTLVLKEPAELQQNAERYQGLIKATAITEQLFSRFQNYKTLSLHSLPLSYEVNYFNFQTKSLQRFGTIMGNLPNELSKLAEENQRIIIFCPKQAEELRLKQLFLKTPLEHNPKIKLTEGYLTNGFQFPEINTVFTSSTEIFNRSLLTQRHRAGTSLATRPIETFLELDKGDFVVHIEHGIGRYQGIERMKKEGHIQEFLKLEYHDKAVIYVPVTQIELVQKYIGGTDRPPQLDRLGSLIWPAKKDRAKQAVAQLAQELLTIQALREKEAGIAYPTDTDWQKSFEASFPYEDTPDQEEVTLAIKKDMESSRPMDRLICGDVGYGKTELAMRAAFKAVMAGKQVAVLVPTTVLAQQHMQNFQERMADYPVNIDMLSRFKTKTEQSAIVKQLASGEVDIIIGTHRLLQPDIRFDNLGLIVVDEEQRFGVEHKERLKQLRATVDILTLTATPIPRTLHMSLLGIRDISTLATPPQNRHAVETYLVRFDPVTIRDGIRRELNRAGQVYFVHNRIIDIAHMAEILKKIVPEATYTIVHGQLNEDLIEERMKQFVAGQIDILLSTNIIESGLDIPRVNTIFIDNADHFGLADLHQLRGRVGRYKHQAFAYLLLPRHRPIAPDAEKRLQAIQEFNELGAGFKIALRDMEIRGVGNILGKEQHGYISAIGYDLYCRLLEVAVKSLRNEPIKLPVDTSIDLPIDAYLPTEYIPLERQRIEMYRKLSRAAKPEQVLAIQNELEDRFGHPLPQPVQYLLEVTRLRLAAQEWGIYSIAMAAPDSAQARYYKERVIVGLYHNQIQIQRLKKKAPRPVRIIDDNTIHICLPLESVKTPDKLLRALEKLLE